MTTDDDDNDNDNDNDDKDKDNTALGSNNVSLVIASPIKDIIFWFFRFFFSFFFFDASLYVSHTERRNVLRHHSGVFAIGLSNLCNNVVEECLLLVEKRKLPSREIKFSSGIVTVPTLNKRCLLDTIDDIVCCV